MYESERGFVGKVQTISVLHDVEGFGDYQDELPAGSLIITSANGWIFALTPDELPEIEHQLALMHLWVAREKKRKRDEAE